MSDVGRPLKFQSVQDMQEKIDAFFNECDTKGEPYTMTGLALELGLSRQGLLNYSARDEYMDTIKRARQRVEAFVERRLFSGGSPIGVIFNLKNNFYWKDKQELEFNDVSAQTEDELKDKINRLLASKD